ncbi:O-methyltransferase [Halobacteriaceae archaeon GCM10025711]
MSELLTGDVERLLALTAGDADPVLESMEAYADERSFPIVGRDVGRFLRLVARMVDAERVFEFGSGFGYSAYWFGQALPADGSIVLTDYDDQNVASARTFLERAGIADRAEFVVGDAMDAFPDHDGPFDVVLVDHDKERYVDAFEMARDELTDGGVVVADNMMAGPVTPDQVVAGLSGDADLDVTTRGIVDYIERVRDDPAFETSFLPLGEGIAVSYRL